LSAARPTGKIESMNGSDEARRPTGSHNAGFTDIRADSRVERLLPAWLHPYARLARLDRPIGTWLLYLPGCWSIALAVPHPDLVLLILFGIGAIAMRGAGCTWNDYVDREIDAKVERTARRPLASGALTPRQALAFLALQLAVGLAILLTFDRVSILVGALALVPVAVYPFMKRVTWWPQAFLGITFNWGALLGWSAATGGSLAWPALFLYAGGIAWTLFYDTIYAHQDKEDDALVGVKSTARLFGEQTRPWLIAFAIVALACWALALAIADTGWPAWPMLLAVAGHFALQLRDVVLDDPANCLARFRSNRNLGLLLFLAILLGQLAR
jgi:4-hydroxybenzoate polyprenyltransferase